MEGSAKDGKGQEEGEAEEPRTLHQQTVPPWRLCHYCAQEPSWTVKRLAERAQLCDGATSLTAPAMTREVKAAGVVEFHCLLTYFDNKPSAGGIPLFTYLF